MGGLFDPLIEVVELFERRHPYVGVVREVGCQPGSARFLRPYSQEVWKRQRGGFLPLLSIRVTESSKALASCRGSEDRAILGTLPRVCLASQ
jgi:hypothetical protein